MIKISQYEQMQIPPTLSP